MNQGGDQLARGARSAQFGGAGLKITQERWDAIWAEEPTDEKKKSTKKKK